VHERDARPIGKGRLGKPVEFGYQALVSIWAPLARRGWGRPGPTAMIDPVGGPYLHVSGNDDGVVLDLNLEQGDPPDAPQPSA